MTTLLTDKSGVASVMKRQFVNEHELMGGSITFLFTSAVINFLSPHYYLFKLQQTYSILFHERITDVDNIAIRYVCQNTRVISVECQYIHT